MDKKILAGSIIAVVVIVLASFTSVVGFQSTDSSKVRFSPLFSIRSKRAVDKDSKDTLTSNYIGKEKQIWIPLPKRDNRAELLQKIIDIISKMDDQTFNRFVSIIVNRAHQSNNIKDEILTMLNLFRNNPNDVEDSYINHSGDFYWIPGLFLVGILSLIFIYFMIVISAATDCFPEPSTISLFC